MVSLCVKQLKALPEEEGDDEAVMSAQRWVRISCGMDYLADESGKTNFHGYTAV